MPGFGVQAGGRAVALCQAFIIKRDEGCMAKTINIHKGGSLRSDLNDLNESYAIIYWYTMNNLPHPLFFKQIITRLSALHSLHHCIMPKISSEVTLGVCCQCCQRCTVSPVLILIPKCWSGKQYICELSVYPNQFCCINATSYTTAIKQA